MTSFNPTQPQTFIRDGKRIQTLVLYIEIDADAPVDAFDDEGEPLWSVDQLLDLIDNNAEHRVEISDAWSLYAAARRAYITRNNGSEMDAEAWLGTPGAPNLERCAKELVCIAF